MLRFGRTRSANARPRYCKQWQAHWLPEKDLNAVIELRARVAITAEPGEALSLGTLSGTKLLLHGLMKQCNFEY